MNIDIENVNNFYRTIVPEELRKRIFDITDYPIINGYNIKCSYRNGGKTTNVILWSMCANMLFGSHISYMRTDKTMTTISKIKTIFDAINTYTLDDGRNYIQHIYNDKYNKVYYLSREKRFVLAREDSTDLEIKNAPTIMYVHSVDLSDSLRSGFADINLDIVLYDEFIDNSANKTTFINFLHILSTFFRLRYNSIVFMCCNLSTGNPTILQQMGVYTKIQAQEIPYMIYTTEYGTKIGVQLLEVSEEMSTEREQMNANFFGFKLDGIDIIRGCTVSREPYRHIPDNAITEPTNIFMYACGTWLQFYYASSTEWQPLIYAKQCIEPPHHDNITITDDKLKAITTPFTYYGIMRDSKMCIDICKHARRHDMCYDSYMTYIAVKSFYDFFKIPENI